MKEMNSCVIYGWITDSAVLSRTTSGVPFAKFSIVDKKRTRGSNGETEEKASFFNLKFYGKRAESVYSYLRKGVRVMVIATAIQERWTTAEGKNTSRVVFSVSDFEFIGSGGNYSRTNNTNNIQPDGEQDAVVSFEPQQEQQVEADNERDIPF